MLSRELQITLNLAITEARNRRHEYLTLEHVLFAMLHDPTALEVLQACGIDSEPIKEELEEFFREAMETLPDDLDDVGPEQTLAFQRSIQRAAYHVQSSGKKELDAASYRASLKMTGPGMPMDIEQNTDLKYRYTEIGTPRRRPLKPIANNKRTPTSNKQKQGNTMANKGKQTKTEALRQLTRNHAFLTRPVTPVQVQNANTAKIRVRNANSLTPCRSC